MSENETLEKPAAIEEVKLQAWLPIELYEKVKSGAKKRGLSIKTLVIIALEKELALQPQN